MLFALDLNPTRCGWAVGGPADSRPRSGSWKLFGTETEADLARSCRALYNSISDLGKLLHPNIVYYEAPFDNHRGNTNHRSARGQFSVAAIAMAAGLNAGAQVVPVQVQSWRKTFCGHGRPEDPKAATMARCRLFGWEVDNHDEADAVGIWVHAMSLRYASWAPRATPLFGRVA